MQICRILPPQYVKDKIFGRTRRMCGRWRLCSFPRVVVFGRRRLLLPQPSPGGPRERFLVDSLRGGPPSASSQILRRLRFSGAPQPLSLRYSTILHLPPAVCGGGLRFSSCLLPGRAEAPFVLSSPSPFCRRWARPLGMPAPSLSFCCARRSTPNPNKTICIRIWIQLHYITY